MPEVLNRVDLSHRLLLLLSLLQVIPFYLEFASLGFVVQLLQLAFATGIGRFLK